MLQLSLQNILPFVTENEIDALTTTANQCNSLLHDGTGKGSDFLGWLHLPSKSLAESLNDINSVASNFQSNCQYVVVVGIGGSYLGARAVIEALSHSFAAFKKNKTEILYAGQNIGEDYLAEMLELLKDKSFGIVNISKSGTTTEPAIAFRLLKNLLENQIGKENAKQKIVAITDATRGALHSLAIKEGYKRFVIPDNVGGRFSVLTPVGLLPIAIAGYNVEALLQGAAEMEECLAPDVPYADNIAEQYAVARNLLYRKGKKIEILANFNPKLHYFAEWWKQLYGESEGKEHKGIFTAAVDFTTDLHSMGQWIQQGERTIFETILSVSSPNTQLCLPADRENLDALNYLQGKRIDEVNKMAELGTQLAHIDGGVPVINLTIPALNEYSLGQLIYFFEKACGISGYLLGVNPFDQPGVEAYKNNMFALLNKPGYEQQHRAIIDRLGQPAY